MRICPTCGTDYLAEPCECEAELQTIERVETVINDHPPSIMDAEFWDGDA